MTQGNPLSDEEAKKKTLKLLLRSKPTVHVETSAGRVYLYPLRVRDMTDFGKVEPGDAVNQIRDFLPSIGSLILESDEAPERAPLDAAIISGLSDDDIERIADAYAKSSSWQTFRENSQERTPAVREAGEAASAFLVRLLKAEVDGYNQSAKSLFDQVRKSTSALGSTLSAYEELAKFAKPAPLEIPSIRTDHWNAMNEQFARQARERAEELEMVRLTGKMTAESAKTLKDLAEAATTLMEQMDERDKRTDQSTRKQITIAVWSVGVSAVLALFALIASGFAYFQDRDNNISGNLWQTKLLAAIEQGNQKHSAVERENQALREQVKSMDARIEEMEAAQRAAAKSTSSKQKPDRGDGATNRNGKVTRAQTAVRTDQHR